MLLSAAQPDPTRFMETLDQRKRAGGGFTGSDRFLGLFSAPEPATTGLELHEDEIFSFGSESSISSLMTMAAKNPCRNPSPKFSPSFRRRIFDRNFGILAALPEWNPNPNPNVISPVSVSCSSSVMIPPLAMAKPKQEKVQQHSSAPVSIPVANVNARNRGRKIELDFDCNGDDEFDDETMMMPPHEIVARRDCLRESSSPAMTTFSVLEGAGRTLKGRDLRRMRNAVFRTIGVDD